MATTVIMATVPAEPTTPTAYLRMLEARLREEGLERLADAFAKKAVETSGVQATLDLTEEYFEVADQKEIRSQLISFSELLHGTPGDDVALIKLAARIHNGTLFDVDAETLLRLPHPLILAAVAAAPSLAAILPLDDHNLLKEAVEATPHTLNYLAEQPRDICLAAVRARPMAIQYIREPDEEITIAAVEAGLASLEHIKKQTPAICKAFMRHGDLTQIGALEFQDAEDCLHAIRNCDPSDAPRVARGSKAQTPQFCKEAFAKNPKTFPFLLHQTPAMCRTAVGFCPTFILQAKHTDEEMICAAVSNTPSLLLKVASRTPNVLRAAVSSKPEAITWFPRELQTPELAVLSVTGWGETLRAIRHDLITPDLCALAVSKHPRAILHVPKHILSDDLLRAAIDLEPILADEFVGRLSDDLILLAVKNLGHRVSLLPKICASNISDQVKLAIVEQCPEALFLFSDFSGQICAAAAAKSPLIYGRLPQEMRRDREVALAAACASVSSSIDDNLITTEFLLEVFRRTRSSEIFSFYHQYTDTDTWLAAIAIQPDVVLNVRQPADERLLVAAVSADGMLLSKLTHETRTLRVCAAAVRNNPLAVAFVPTQLIDDPDAFRKEAVPRKPTCHHEDDNYFIPF